MTISIQTAIDTLLTSFPGAPFKDSVDVFKIGDPTQELTGIVTTFLATYDVIAQTAQLGANLIISHEPVFYNHTDETSWLENNPVYEAKRRLISEHNIVIWRFHDYLHTIQPDPTSQGLIADLGWQSYLLPQKEPYFPPICQLPATSLKELAYSIKEKLGLGPLRMVGELNMTCRNVALMVGFPASRWQIKALEHQDIDVLLTGEIHEWETSEYTRDAISQHLPKALIVLGHASSEESGMRLIIPWLQAQLPEIPVTFVPSGSSIQWLA